ncbi:transmembrane 4 L6 family member 4-like [Puntigrus tetrazona]|uniref:transmembrane 4 L6 family member 4-like n=1 Tax=Puntigrus tetrazona TaxID=1606681 RepID=UPI001C8A5457|nr:transmembrane 4 L6 family member 4-like [Puntigrus tetrazona]
MCSGNFAKCLGITLLPLAIICILCNILLFFPGGNVADQSSDITNEVFYFGGILGSGVLMIFPALVFLGLKNNDCCGCCGNESCGKRFAMFSSILFAAVGAAGATYSVIVSCVAINHGPKCFISYFNGTVQQIATYPFEDGNYLSNRTLWDLCEGPGDIVTWHLTLFSMLLIAGLVQIGLCAFQVINGLIGTICGDGCCGSS